MIARGDPRNVSSFLSNGEILNLWTTLDIQVLYILTKTARNKYIFSIGQTLLQFLCFRRERRQKFRQTPLLHAIARR